MNEAYLLDVANGRKGLTPALLRGTMTALAPVYVAGLKVYLWPYNVGLRKRTRLACPVICVGNLTTGGTGKTPLTQTLCRRLTERGLRVAILSRGYGGQHERGCAIVSDGTRVRLTAPEAGDEAFLLAQSLPGIPVVVGKDRRVTGALAVQTFQPNVIVLDDGMQFWQLERDVNICLLNACAPFDNGWTFPRGLLREPPSHLRRAQIVVLTNTARAGEKQVKRVREQAARLAPEARVFEADLAPEGLRSVFAAGPQDSEQNRQKEIGWLRGRRVASLCALGNPAHFEVLLETLGAERIAAFRFRDHQAIEADELRDCVQQACDAGAEAVITTAKDAVKMTPQTLALPLLALDVRMAIEDEPDFLQAVMRIAGLPHT